MKSCEVPNNTLIGHSCRRDPRETIESCFLYQEIQLETPKTVRDLLPLIKKLSCKNKDVLIDIINAKAEVK